MSVWRSSRGNPKLSVKISWGEFVKMRHLKYNAGKLGILIRERWSFMVPKCPNLENLHAERFILDASPACFSSMAMGRNAVDAGWFESAKKVVGKSTRYSKPSGDAKWMNKDAPSIDGIPVALGGQSKHYIIGLQTSNGLYKQYGRHYMLLCSVRTLASNSASQSSARTSHQEKRKDISTVEDPFDAPTYNIPEKPVTFAEGASYTLIILAGLGVAGAAAYAVFKELIFQPKEYKVFGKALERVQSDSQVRVRIGSPITGYGQESRNRAARQRIPNRTWTDEDGVERVEVNFYIRGPHGAGKVFTEMFKDKVEKQWKFTYLIVEINSPSPAQLMLESYVPA
eukprot:TRINITY_DN2018_c0_g1_i2.p1 TRINITY_DN2018_c0_g1~~TRINITY_DN2018_c0_g1_i2.p1  ORF type:complete len:341 (+),score=67.85 TRINITY_DN2018_c0_g1_i2:168-1190(+)